MSGHILMLDGDMMGITPDMTLLEVRTKTKEFGLTAGLIMTSGEVVVVIDNKNYYFKDRHYGRCDFKSDPPPENPICGT